jgi:hypothetical protein
MIIDHVLIKRILQSQLLRRQTASKDVKSWERAANEIKQARWFFVHCIANGMVVVTGFSSVVSVLTDPQNAMDVSVNFDRSVFGNASKWPMIIINAVHVYHMVGGYSLSSADYFHHLLFIPLCGVPGQLFNWGAISNFQAYFISGLPGGIDYLLLGLQKIRAKENKTSATTASSTSTIADKLYEKRFNANLNVWLRCPGTLFGTALIYQCAISNRHSIPLAFLLLQLVLPPFNALYYCKQAVANFSVHHMIRTFRNIRNLEENLSERTSVTTGERVLQWHPAFSVPQRGS